MENHYLNTQYTIIHLKIINKVCDQQYIYIFYWYPFNTNQHPQNNTALSLLPVHHCIAVGNPKLHICIVRRRISAGIHYYIQYIFKLLSSHTGEYISANRL